MYKFKLIIFHLILKICFFSQTIKVYYRNCSSGIWLPPTGKYDAAIHGSTFQDNNCIKDRYSGELFCTCFGNSCNGYNTGVMSIFSKCLNNFCFLNNN